MLAAELIELVMQRLRSLDRFRDSGFCFVKLLGTERLVFDFFRELLEVRQQNIDRATIVP